MWKSQKPVGGKRTLAQWMGLAIATVAARLLASPILQEYDAVTIGELAPCKFYLRFAVSDDSNLTGKLALGELVYNHRFDSFGIPTARTSTDQRKRNRVKAATVS